MQIDFATSGGFANRELTYRAETSTLPEDQAQELERLVESSGVFDLQQNDIPPQAAAGPADIFSYRLSLSDQGGRQTTLWFDDISAPAAVRPLLTHLRKLAQDQKKSDA